MEFAYEVFPKVFSVGAKASISMRGLHYDKTFKSHQDYIVHCFSKVNKSEKVELKIEATEKGYLKFSIPLKTRGEYLIDVYDEKDREKVLTTAHIFAASPGLAKKKAYKGDLHIHTTYSDGGKSPIWMAIMGKKLGFDFIAITDHDKYFPSLEAIKEAREMNLNLLIFPGEEITAYDGNGGGMHLLSYCASSGLTSHRNNMSLYEREYQEILDELRSETLIQGLSKEIYANRMWFVKKVRRLGGYAVIAHPYWVPKKRRQFDFNRLVYNQLLGDGLFDAVEVLGDSPPEDNLLSVVKYYEEMAKGKKIPIVSNSDAHDYPHTYGQYWTVVFAEKLKKEDIFQAIFDLKSVACEHHPNENFEAVGPFELIEYVFFLQREFFPLHDKICALEGELSMRVLEGKDKYSQELVNLRKELDNLYCGFWGYQE